MSQRLLICESPGKIKKLKQILGPGWNIKATMGHIVELANDGEYRLGFTLDERSNRIECRYVPRGTRGKQVLKELREAVKLASEIFIATDPDREGETIGWHVAEQLRLKNPRRVVYSEITEKAVRQAIANPRSLDLNLVAAGRCRDALDKLVGYRGSPLLWKLNNGAKSMGRVQSATLHILCTREREIKAFVPQDYWSVYVDYAEGFRAYYMGNAVSLEATLNEADISDDATSSPKQQVESVRVLSQEQADQLVAQARGNSHYVVQVEAKATTRKPPAPFTTSSLQQAAGSRLKFGSEKTMQIAQRLYEQGHITYMRTDSVALSEDYCSQARKWLEQHDPENVPPRVAKHKSKAGAQEAHEAIRPTHVDNTSQIALTLSDEEFRLYELIWNRAIASQCQHARLQKTRIVTQSGTVFWLSCGQIVTFRGYTAYWNDLSGDLQLPVVKQQQVLTLKQAGSQKKQTQPPPRYSEPKLVQEMERKGIGRPSTYAPTVKTLRDREYVCTIKGYLQPTQLGLEVDEFLGRVLPDLIQSEFTARMEGELDAIAAGKDWERYLLGWNRDYFAPALAAAYRSLGVSSRTTSSSTTAEVTDTRCPMCGQRLSKIHCTSKKLQADHFLKCPNQECGTAMFWSKQKQQYELPYSGSKVPAQNYKVTAPKASKNPAAKKVTKKAPQQNRNIAAHKAKSSPQNLTGYNCPVCGQLLEMYEYSKGNEKKQMLRCSDAQARRQDDHKDVAYFTSRGVFWSPKYGEIIKKT